MDTLEEKLKQLCGLDFNSRWIKALREDQKREAKHKELMKERYKVIQLFNSMKQKGQVEWKNQCSINNKNCSGRIEGHHNNYNEPLKVLELCREHHLAWHRTFIPEHK